MCKNRLGYGDEAYTFIMAVKVVYIYIRLSQGGMVDRRPIPLGLYLALTQWLD